MLRFAAALLAVVLALFAASSLALFSGSWVGFAAFVVSEVLLVSSLLESASRHLRRRRRARMLRSAARDYGSGLRRPRPSG